jgi:hypothetical protein
MVSASQIKVNPAHSVYAWLVKRSLREHQSLCRTATDILASAVRSRMEREKQGDGQMVCEPCRKERHPECPGGTWCDCQHKPRESEEQPE